MAAKVANGKVSKVQTGLVVIRPATSGDIADIWRLLHCEGRDMSDEDIAAILGDLYLLYQGAKLVGVYRDSRSGEEAWASVHPLYPQGVVEEIMAEAVNGLFDDISQSRYGVCSWISRLIRKPSFRFISS